MNRRQSRAMCAAVLEEGDWSVLDLLLARLALGYMFKEPGYPEHTHRLRARLGMCAKKLGVYAPCASVC